MKKIIGTLVLSLTIIIIGAQFSFVYADEFTQTENCENYNPFDNDNPKKVDK